MYCYAITSLDDVIFFIIGVWLPTVQQRQSCKVTLVVKTPFLHAQQLCSRVVNARTGAAHSSSECVQRSELHPTRHFVILTCGVD
eukprot:5855128-Amphidinium_carterae.1